MGQQTGNSHWLQWGKIQPWHGTCSHHRLGHHHPKLEQGPHQQGDVVLGEEWGRAAAAPSPASFFPVQAAEPHGWNWTPTPSPPCTLWVSV